MKMRTLIEAIDSSRDVVVSNVTLEAYNARLLGAASRLGLVPSRLSNGAYVLRAPASSAPVFAVLSGLHGDEPAGPLSVLAWLEGMERLDPRYRLLIFPMVNVQSWGTGIRLWGGWANLNSAWVKGDVTLPFIREAMEILSADVPMLFFDVHEDEVDRKPYVWQHVSDDGELHGRLTRHGARKPTKWRRLAGESETYVRSLGCPYTATLEVPPSWPMQKRVDWHVRSLKIGQQFLIDRLVE